MRASPPLILALAVAAACSGSDAEPSDATPALPGAVSFEAMSPTDHLVRASMALRGVRPTAEELIAVQDNPAAIEGLVDQYLESEEFGETVRDLHAELYLLRTDTQGQLPTRGILGLKGYTRSEVHHSTSEAPLRFVEDIVMSDRPYTEILTADYTLANEVVADIYGLPFDDDGAEWQRTVWVDGRPQSGLLSDSEMWRRHVSNAANFHRGRASFISSTFLCEDIAGRDVLVEGAIDINDPEAVATAVRTQETCVGCHAVLDPLAAFFWGYKEQLREGAILEAYTRGCEGNYFPGDELRGSYEVEHWCYPLKFYNSDDSDNWDRFGLLPPSFFGQPAESMTDLGELLADDDRFKQCTARSFFGYLAQVDKDDVPHELTTELRDAFESSGYSAKELAKQVVLSDAFRSLRSEDPSAFVPGLLSVRPEQYSRAVAELTGFTWLADQDTAGCNTSLNSCWETINLATTDLFGFRNMSGGIDSLSVVHPTHSATPTKMMAIGKMADEAAGWVVTEDLSLTDPAARKLLSGVEADTTDPAAVRAQLAALHLRVLGEFVDANGAEVDATFALWSGVQGSANPTEAWAVVISAMLQDVRMVYF